MKRKITEVSVFEFFLCIFVILIHLLSEGVNVFPKWSVLSIVFFTVTRLLTFAVPAFVFTSALKLFYKFSERKFSYMPFLVDRIKKIYLPYIVMVIVYYVVFIYAFHIYEFNPVSLIKYILNGDLSAQFYFIVLIMQFYLLMPFWILLSKNKNKVFNIVIVTISIICSVAVRVILSGEDYAHKIFPSYLVFWVLGMYAGMYYNKFIRFLSRSRLMIYAGWLIFAILHCVTSYMEYGGIINNFLPTIFVVFFCLFSTFGFYQYAYGLTESLESRGKGFFISISGASYSIYLVHCLIITSTQEILNSLGIQDTMVRFLITTVITYVLSIVSCVLWATFHNNIKQRMSRLSTRRSRKKAARKRYL